jgi:AcrR family transcriptional regulator
MYIGLLYDVQSNCRCAYFSEIIRFCLRPFPLKIAKMPNKTPNKTSKKTSKNVADKAPVKAPLKEPGKAPKKALRKVAKKAPKKRRDDLKGDLIVAAEKLIREGGTSALSLRKLAEVTGVTTMATYHHFANREALLVQIAVNGFAELADMMTADLSDDATPAANVKALMRGYLKFALENMSIYHLMFGQEIQGKPLIPEFKSASRRSFYLMANALKKHLETDGHAVDADAVGISFWGTLHGLVCLVSDGTLLYKSRSEEKLDRLIDQAVKGLYYLD